MCAAEIRRLRCNSCLGAVDGVGYVTRCAHFLCPRCAKIEFQNSPNCPICHCALTAEDVQEISIGLSLDSPPVASLYRMVLQEAAWESILQNSRLLHCAVAEIDEFIAVQALKELDSTTKSLIKVNEENLALSNQMVKTYHIKRIQLLYLLMLIQWDNHVCFYLHKVRC